MPARIRRNRRNSRTDAERSSGRPSILRRSCEGWCRDRIAVRILASTVPRRSLGFERCSMTGSRHGSFAKDRSRRPSAVFSAGTRLARYRRPSGRSAPCGAGRARTKLCERHEIGREPTARAARFGSASRPRPRRSATLHRADSLIDGFGRQDIVFPVEPRLARPRRWAGQTARRADSSGTKSGDRRRANRFVGGRGDGSARVHVALGTI